MIYDTEYTMKNAYDLQEVTLAALLERSFALYHERKCVCYVEGETMTYAHFYEKVHDVIKQLRTLGIGPGDHIAILSENMPHWGVAYFAITTMGAVAVPILPDFHTSEVHHILKDSLSKGIFVSEKYLDTVLEQEENGLLFAIDLKTLSMIEELNKPDLVTEKFEQFKKSMGELRETFLSNSVPENSEPARVAEDDLAVLLYTSGTTGHSKGVMLTHKNLTSNAMSTRCVITTMPDDRFLSILPLAHTFECTVGMLVPFLHGSAIYYLNKVPTPTILLKAMQQVRPTYMLSVPLVIEKICKTKVFPKFQSNLVIRNLYKIPFFRKLIHRSAGKKLMESFGGKIRFFGIGGAPLSPLVEKFLIEARFPYVIGYGLTETSPLLAGTPSQKPKLRSTGPAMDGIELKLHNYNPHTKEGEIIARGPNIMKGYYKDPERTAEVLNDEGWFFTGDLGYFDDEGYLFISGRSKNVIIGPSGENIYPEQIEAVINENEYIADSLVYDQEGKLVARIHLDYERIDEKFSANQHADSELREDIDAYLEELRLQTNKKLSAFKKIHKFIEHSEPFVTTPTKKIKRYLYIS